VVGKSGVGWSVDMLVPLSQRFSKVRIFDVGAFPFPLSRTAQTAAFSLYRFFTISLPLFIFAGKRHDFG
jgi:hypothetical protein